jgi:hypothetical protein
MFVVLLTNRVHEARARNPVKVIGDVRSDLSDAASLAVNEGEHDDIAVDAVFRADSERGWNTSRRALAHGRGRHAKSLSSKHGHAGTSAARSKRSQRSSQRSSTKHSSGKHTSSKSKRHGA